MENIADRPKPNERQLAEARSLFKSDGSEGKVVSVVDSEYLVGAYGGLSQDQLGELLAVGHTLIQTSTGKLRIELKKESEREFVRALFVKRMTAAGQPVPKSGDKPADDAQLVASQRSAEQTSNIAAAAARTKAKDEAEGSASSKDEGLGSLDEELEGEAKAGSKGDGTSADTSSDQQKTSKDGERESDGAEGADKTATRAEGAHETGSNEGKKDDEHYKGTLHDRVHLAPHIAEMLVDFKTGTLKRELVEQRHVIGFDLGDDMHVAGVELETFKAHPGNEVYEYTLRIDVSVHGQINPTYHVYTYAPSLKSGTAGEMHMPDPAGFVRKMRGAVTLDGNRGALSGSPSFTHGRFGISVLAVREVKDYGVGERETGSPNGSSDGMAEVKLFVKWTKIENQEGSIIVRNSDNELQIVHERDEMEIRLVLPRKQ